MRIKPVNVLVKEAFISATLNIVVTMKHCNVNHSLSFTLTNLHLFCVIQTEHFYPCR